VPIYQADLAFRAVYLVAGQHTVTMRFDPTIWKLAVSLTLVTLGVLTTWAATRAVRQWRR
jgi:uncharacterized membrane protein YjgN (DUF898 family)